MKRKIIVIYSEKDAEFLKKIHEILSKEKYEYNINPESLPDDWDNVVILPLVTDNSLSEIHFNNYVKNALQKNLSVIPVVTNKTEFDFNKVSISSKNLGELNFVDLEDRSEPSLIRAVGEFFGEDAPNEHRTVFISYSRKDSEKLAEKLYSFFRENEFEVFLDSKSISAGKKVQEKIHEKMLQKDFILFIDSPSMIDVSTWVQEEITFAHDNRIPMSVIRTGELENKTYLSGIEHLPFVDLKESNNKTSDFEKIKLLVLRGLSKKVNFDERIERVLSNLILPNVLIIKNQEKRQKILSKAKNKLLLLEYENSYPSLEILHRLYESLNKIKPKNAIFVSGDYTPSIITKNAIDWIKSTNKTTKKLHVTPLSELKILLESLSII
jgi:hypothetical protein